MHLERILLDGYNVIFENAVDPRLANTKVIDSTGYPLPVYHGTMEEFDQFDKQFLGSANRGPDTSHGFYFTDDKEVAKNYTYREEYTIGDALRDISNVDPNHYLFNRVKNDLLEARRYDGSYSEVPRDTKRDLNRLGIKTEDKWHGKIIEAYLNIEDPYVYDFNGGAWNPNKQADILRIAKQSGNDGVIFKNIVEEDYTMRPATDYVVFDTNQIFIINSYIF